MLHTDGLKSPIHGRERCLYLRRVVPDLGVREAQRSQPSGRVSLISNAIPRLLGSGAVISQAVRLNDQTEPRPVEVDPESVDVDSGQRLWKSGSPSDWEKSAFEFGIGEQEGRSVEDPSHGSRPA
jgi:hypothetical protein